MAFHKSRYLSIYKFCFNLLLLPAAAFMLVNCSQPDAARSPVTPDSQSPTENAVNINTATIETLEKLPHVGQETAKKIIEYREKYGKFRRTENLILVRGMSDKKFRDLRSLVKAE